MRNPSRNWGLSQDIHKPCKGTPISLACARSSYLMSHTSILTHIVFRTKSSVPAIIPEHSHMLYRYIWGMVKHRRSVLLRINGMPDHVHLFVELNPSIALSEFVGAIKATTSRWMKDLGNSLCSRGGQENMQHFLMRRETNIRLSHT